MQRKFKNFATIRIIVAGWVDYQGLGLKSLEQKVVNEDSAEEHNIMKDLYREKPTSISRRIKNWSENTDMTYNKSEHALQPTNRTQNIHSTAQVSVQFLSRVPRSVKTFVKVKTNQQKDNT